VGDWGAPSLPLPPAPGRDAEGNGRDTRGSAASALPLGERRKETEMKFDWPWALIILLTAFVAVINAFNIALLAWVVR